MEKKNIIGPQIRRIRGAKGWTQNALAARCNLLGWDLSRATLSKVEAQIRCVDDLEIFVLAAALQVEISSFYPSEGRAVFEQVRRRQALED